MGRRVVFGVLRLLDAARLPAPSRLFQFHAVSLELNSICLEALDFRVQAMRLILGDRVVLFGLQPGL